MTFQHQSPVKIAQLVNTQTLQYLANVLPVQLVTFANQELLVPHLQFYLQITVMQLQKELMQQQETFLYHIAQWVHITPAQPSQLFQAVLAALQTPSQMLLVNLIALHVHLPLKALQDQQNACAKVQTENSCRAEMLAFAKIGMYTFLMVLINHKKMELMTAMKIFIQIVMELQLSTVKDRLVFQLLTLAIQLVMADQENES